MSGKLLQNIYFIGANGDMPCLSTMSSKLKKRLSIDIIVTNVNTGESLEYASIYAASKELGVNGPKLRRYLDSGKCLENMYILKSK